MMTLAVMSLALAQQGSQAAIRIDPENPLTWTLEYPAIISSYLDNYYNCLRSSDIRIGIDTSFEAQHKQAITGCAKTKGASFKGATHLLAKFGRGEEKSPEYVNNLLDTLEIIHVARGKDLDDQLAIKVSGHAYGQRMTAKGVVISDAPPDSVDDAEWVEPVTPAEEAPLTE